MLTISGVSKRLGGKPILDNISLSVAEGSVFGLVGVNGAGKSTLLRCICGVYTPDSGTVTLDGTDVIQNPAAREDILYVSDDPWYPHGATVERLKEFYRSFYRLDEAAYQKYLGLFGLDPKKPISTFSKGMKRQTSLLFALAVHPKLLLLDEVFDGLDPLVRYDFKKALAELMEEEHLTVVISSHNLKELEDVSDSYGLLEEGRVLTWGDLIASKENVNKYQMAFPVAKTRADFEGFDLMRFSAEGRVVTLVIRGKQEEIVNQLEALSPLMLDVLPVSFEELFIYEADRRGDHA
ncbi:MAG: ABC transporter ATP-binding protein [bacterium]